MRPKEKKVKDWLDRLLEKIPKLEHLEQISRSWNAENSMDSLLFQCSNCSNENFNVEEKICSGSKVEADETSALVPQWNQAIVEEAHAKGLLNIRADGCLACSLWQAQNEECLVGACSKYGRLTSNGASCEIVEADLEGFPRLSSKKTAVAFV